jgi:DNA-binding Lrp family transcriptional regulator
VTAVDQSPRTSCQRPLAPFPRYTPRVRAVFVMIKTEPGHGTEVANRIADIESFSEGYSITGQYDVLVKLYVEDIDGLARLIERDIHSIPFVRETFTILTFEAFAAD